MPHMISLRRGLELYPLAYRCGCVSIGRSIVHKSERGGEATVGGSRDTPARRGRAPLAAGTIHQGGVFPGHSKVVKP
jgi:hypothetical protein